jgi:hypothetical protein
VLVATVGAGFTNLKGVEAWKKVDEAFWEKFKVVSAGNEMPVKACYEK